MQDIIFGAGCFWGVQTTFDALTGVTETQVGYAGGTTQDPTYHEVCTGHTNHAEVIKVTFDPQQISLENLLDVFWHSHNPTTLNRQGPDVGSQYRSCIFYFNQEQFNIIATSKEMLEKNHPNHTIVTQIEKAPPFYRAEEYHQHYHKKHPR